MCMWGGCVCGVEGCGGVCVCRLGVGVGGGCTVSPVEKITNQTTGTLPVRSRCTVDIQSWYGRSAAEVRSRCGTSYSVVWSRCGQGTLPVRSWYGILKVCSRLVFSTRLEPDTRTVPFIVRIAQSRLSWICKVFAA